MEKNKIIKILNKAKHRMTDRKNIELSDMLAIMEALGYIIERLDGEAETTQPMVAEQVPAEKPKKERKKRNTVDYGKITALYKAGWSQKKIAEEMGVTPTSISMALKRYKDKMDIGFIWDPEEKEFIKKR